MGNGLWDVQNRARALDNTMYVIAPNPAGYYVTPESLHPIDVTGGESMIADYQGRVISKHHSGGTASYAGGIIDIEALRQYRARSCGAIGCVICALNSIGLFTINPCMKRIAAWNVRRCGMPKTIRLYGRLPKRCLSGVSGKSQPTC